MRSTASWRGSSTLSIAGEEVAITPRDHFGIPAGLPATLTAEGAAPLVLLDAMIERSAARSR